MPNDTTKKQNTDLPSKNQSDEKTLSQEKGEGSSEEQESVYPIFTSAEEEEDQIRAAREETDEEGEEQEEEPVNERSSGKPATVQEFILNELPYRAERAEQRLREQLSALIAITLKDTGEQFYLDCTSNPPVCKKEQPAKKAGLGDEVTTGTGPACTVALDSSNLMRIASGSLNPQIAMLSNKISVVGEAGLAVYLFNLVAPRQ